MDNLTHSLVGLALAESIFQRSPTAKLQNRAAVRAAYWAVSIGASNLPDADILLSGLMAPAKLGYLLHHRGHSHTILVALLLGAGLLGVLAWLHRRSFPGTTWDKRAIAALCVAGPALHLLLDYFNSYGVHPFWPFANHWVYGDAVFIVEPLILFALLPVLFFATNRRGIKWACEFAFFGLLAAAWTVPLTKWYSAIGITLFGLVAAVVAKLLSGRRRADVALAVVALIYAGFALLGSHVRARLVADQAQFHESATLRDLVLSPLPANPFCWSVLTVETLAGGARYRVRRGVYAPFARWIDATQCPTRYARSTASLREVADLWGPEYFWEGQYQASIKDFKIFQAYSCAWNAYLRFARVPFLSEEAGDFKAGDLRFDFEPGEGFSEVTLPPDEAFCRTYVPPWDPPRADIFKDGE